MHFAIIPILLLLLLVIIDLHEFVLQKRLLILLNILTLALRRFRLRQIWQ